MMEEIEELKRHRGATMTPEDLKSIRQRLGLSQQALAEEIGVAKRTLQRWEAGHRRISKLAEKIIKAL